MDQDVALLVEEFARIMRTGTPFVYVPRLAWRAYENGVLDTVSFPGTDKMVWVTHPLLKELDAIARGESRLFKPQLIEPADWLVLSRIRVLRLRRIAGSASLPDGSVVEFLATAVVLTSSHDKPFGGDIEGRLVVAKRYHPTAFIPRIRRRIVRKLHRAEKEDPATIVTLARVAKVLKDGSRRGRPAASIR